MASGPEPAPAPAVAAPVHPEGASAQATKAMREIYIGNLPPGTTGSQLQAFLNGHLLGAGLVVPGGGPAPVGGLLAREGPVIACRVTTGSQFGFAEFRTIEETILALAVGELTLGALQLRFGRPRAFISLYGDDTHLASTAAARVRALIAAGVPDSLPSDAAAGTVFPETAAMVAAARPGMPLGVLGQQAAPAGSDAVPASSSTTATGLPSSRADAEEDADGASSSAEAGSALRPGLGGAALVPSGGLMTASMGAAALASTAANEAPAAPAPAAASGQGVPGPDRTCATLEVKGPLASFGEDDVREMFGGFGEISRCFLSGDDDSRRAVLEYADMEAAEQAVALDGMDAGEGPFAVRRMAVDEPGACQPSPCVLLRNTVLRSEVETAQGWADVQQDIREEAARHGPVHAVCRPADGGTDPTCRPRPGDAPDSVPLFVRFETAEAATAAAAAMSNRRFDGRLVTAHCIPVAVFEAATA